MTIWHWRIDTANFTFDAYGESEAHCRAVMAAGWRSHQNVTGASYTFADVASDAPREVRAGECWRDDRVIRRLAPTKG